MADPMGAPHSFFLWKRIGKQGALFLLPGAFLFRFLFGHPITPFAGYPMRKKICEIIKNRKNLAKNC